MKHKIVTRKQWLAARLKLLKAEKELTRRSDDVARQRQKLPWVRIDKEYRFETDEGNASLADLFGGRSQTPRVSLHVRARLYGGVSGLLGHRRRLRRLGSPPGQPRRYTFSCVTSASYKTAGV